MDRKLIGVVTLVLCVPQIFLFCDDNDECGVLGSGGSGCCFVHCSPFTFYRGGASCTLFSRTKILYLSSCGRLILCYG